MSNTRSIAIVGVGGQGTVLTSDILIEGLVDLGFDVKKTEQHGLSQRGGSVNCMVKYGDAVYAPIIADGERMKQVFCNVLDNAAKHGGSGKRIDVSVAAENGSMVIRVRDFGPGIPVEELPYVKQKFYKGSSKARGSGIGLAVCDEIMRLHNGTFDIANAPGGGAVVTMTLPMEK